MRKKFLIGIFAVVSLVFGGLWMSSTNNAYAEVMSGDSLYKLSILQGVRLCYKKYAKNSIELAEFSDWLSVFNTTGWDYGDWDKTSSDYVWITTHVGNSLNSDNRADSNLSCEQVFKGYKTSAKGFKDYYTFPTTIGGMGYQFSYNENVADANSGTANADSDYVTIKIGSITDGSGGNTNRVNTSGGIECSAKQKEKKSIFGTSKGWYWEIDDCVGKITAKYGEKTLIDIETDGNVTGNLNVSGDFDFNYPEAGLTLGAKLYYKTSTSSSRLSLKEALENEKNGFAYWLDTYIKQIASKVYAEPVVSISYEISTPEAGGTENKDSVYVPIDDKVGAAGVMLYGVGVDESLPHVIGKVTDGGNDYDSVSYSWTPYAKYSLYYRYLSDMMSKYPGINMNGCSENRPSSEYAFKNGLNQWCSINIENSIKDEVLNTTFSVVDGVYLKEGIFSDVLEWFKKEGSYDGLSEGQYLNGNIDDGGELTPPGGSGDQNTGQQDVCYADSGTLGWIICPIITAADGIGNTMWKQIEEYHLKVPASQIFKQDGGVRAGWNVARDVANILFVVLFLAVIFSQLTGVGIDNYGIKKILPRLIVVAILANLSYLICELVTDASNIFGMSINDMLTNLAIPSDAESQGIIAQGVAWSLTGLFAGGGVVLFSALSAGSLFGGLAGIGLAVLGIIITIVLALLTLYLTLITREAGIVLCVVIAPIAIVCYALPNTEKYAKKWYEIFKALMVVYPICGAVVGGGRLAGSILASIDNEGMKVAAMIVQVLPFFLVPTLLKNSLSLLGNVGAKLSSFGRSLGKRSSAGLKNTIRNTDRFKDWSQYQRDNSQERRAKGVRKSLEGKGRLSVRQQDRLKKANDILIAAEGRRKRAELGSSEASYDAAIIGQNKRAEAEELQNYMTLVNDKTRNGDNSDKLMGLFDEYMESGNKAGAVAVARIAGRRKDTAAEFLSKKITGQSIERDKDGNLVEERLDDVTAEYDPAMLGAVMKEIATGDNSSAYRESSPFGFEFAAQYNKNYKEKYGDGDVRPEMNYANWRANNRNTSDSLNRYVADSRALVGLKGSSLDEINSLMTKEGAISDKERQRIRKLANETIDNRGKTGVWDSTKARQIYTLAGRLDEYEKEQNGEVSGQDSTSATSGIPSGTQTAAAGAEASTMYVRAESAAQSNAIADQTQSSQKAQQAAQGVRQQQTVSTTGSAMDVQALGDETLLDIATNPNVRMDDATRVAAENEYLRRTQAPNISRQLGSNVIKNGSPGSTDATSWSSRGFDVPVNLGPVASNNNNVDEKMGGTGGSTGGTAPDNSNDANQETGGTGGKNVTSYKDWVSGLPHIK